MALLLSSQVGQWGRSGACLLFSSDLTMTLAMCAECTSLRLHPAWPCVRLATFPGTNFSEEDPPPAQAVGCVHAQNRLHLSALHLAVFAVFDLEAQAPRTKVQACYMICLWARRRAPAYCFALFRELHGVHCLQRCRGALVIVRHS